MKTVPVLRITISKNVFSRNIHTYYKQNQVTMKNLFFNICAFLILALLSTVNVDAQIRTPAPSPGSKLTQTVGLTEITIEYSRPSAKGRAIFAKDGLVPFGTMWRTGANAATKITFGDDVKVGDQELKKGSYALFSKPDAAAWQVMFFNYETSNAGGYGDKTAVATLSVKPQMMNHMVETFTIDINNITNTSATIDLSWEKTMVSIPLTVEVDKRVTADIERVLAGPSQNDYYAAASYYHAAGKDLNKALEWIQKANAKEPKFWMVRTEALILADLGKKMDAIKAAEKSKQLAIEAKNEDYVRMNDKSIAEWSKKN